MLSITAFAMLLPVMSGAASAINLTCRSVPTSDNGELALKPDSDSAPWCDASFKGDATPGIANRVRAIRGHGDRCEIAGDVPGHGADVSLFRMLVGTWMPVSETEPKQFNTYEIHIENNTTATMAGFESLCVYSNFVATPSGQVEADAVCSETILESTGKATFGFLRTGTDKTILIISNVFRKTVNTNRDNQEEDNDDHPWIGTYKRVGE
ncbi:MAG TPA: hypothetical protein VMU69_14240 [Bradyrhizobium sp.]|nr:hypothetical protein [Bradyrhizobium sp.]